MSDSVIQVYPGESEEAKKLLAPLRESIVHKPPFIGGSLQLPPSHFYLFYKNPLRRHVNLANATPDEIEQLTQVCEPASFDHSKEEVTDETRPKRGKIEYNSFSPLLVPRYTDLIKIVRNYLLEGTDSTRQIDIELYELNVYSNGSLFKSHVDIPSRENKFGSLVVAFPTSFEGGVLIFRHDGQEWTFDPSTALSSAPSASESIAYAAFFDNVKHEVSPVTSGHRVMLTYNLYFDEDERASAVDLVSEPPSFPREVKGETFGSRFADLLENPEFLPDGGMLGFGLQNVYQENCLQLKGSDATVYQSLRGLGLEPTLYLYYESEGEIEDHYGTLLHYEPESVCLRDKNLDMFMHEQGGISIIEDEKLTWVTPRTGFFFNQMRTPYAKADWKRAEMETMVGEWCLTVRIGEAGKRLVHSTDAQA
ncbi:hypothetical protein BGW80DRAFT_1179829 [Lactifluus volemus]|nr:hypothetical protein BGW80DRAFT_1179829 [Lactifluus volemus]